MSYANIPFSTKRIALLLIISSLTGCHLPQHRAPVVNLSAAGGYGITQSAYGTAAGTGTAYLMTEKK